MRRYLGQPRPALRPAPIGHYHMLAFALNALRVQNEEPAPNKEPVRDEGRVQDEEEH